jgi:hypothetical protein
MPARRAMSTPATSLRLETTSFTHASSWPRSIRCNKLANERPEPEINTAMGNFDLPVVLS